MESIEELIFVMMSLVFLLMGVVLVASILMSAYNPYDQITFANVEKLRSAMNEVCFTPGHEVSVNFQMPQNTPILSGFFSVLPAWVMRSGGDPNYVLYYESFPPGEAIGWEVYHQFDNILIASLPIGHEGDTIIDARMYAKDIFDTFKSKPKNDDETVEAVVINNIILDDKYRSDFIINPEVENTNQIDEFFLTGIGEEEGFFGYGEWEGNAYKFKNYLGLSPLEKSLIKYQPCGENSLCLKTRSGIYKFPVGMCEERIKGIQLLYDTRNRGKVYTIAIVAVGVTILAVKVAVVGSVIKAITGSIGKVIGSFWKIPFFGRLITIGAGTYGVEEAIGWLMAQFLSFKTSDFYLASPCTLEFADPNDRMIIRINDCNSGSITGEWTTDPSPCHNVIKYPLYKYNDKGKLEYVRDKSNDIVYHYTCVEKIGDSGDDEIYGDNPPDIKYSSGDKCLQIVVTDKKPKDFCWTDDPYKRKKGWDADTVLLAQILDLTPIHEYTNFISEKEIIVLEKSKIEMNMIEKILEKDVSWVWPK